jgi:hypothetical protein
MTIALCDVSGLLKNLLDNLSGKNYAEWLEILRRALRRENPFQDESIMHAIRLKPSQIAGTKALEMLRSQGFISTTNWHQLEVQPLENNNGQSGANRRMTFSLENGQRVEVTTMTWKREAWGEVAKDNEEYRWFPVHVYVEKGERMLAFENHINHLIWYRQPVCDKPLPGATWRAPTPDEIAACEAAIAERDESAFLKLYYADFIDWKEVNNHLVGDEIGWVRITLKEAA